MRSMKRFRIGSAPMRRSWSWYRSFCIAILRIATTRGCQVVHAPGYDHVDGEAGFETLLACQLSDAAAALEDGLEHLEAFAARIPGDTLESIADGVDRNGSHQHPIDGRDACRSMAFPGPHGPQGKIGPGCKGGKAHAQPCGACRPRALKRNVQTSPASGR